MSPCLWTLGRAEADGTHPHVEATSAITLANARCEIEDPPRAVISLSILAFHMIAAKREVPSSLQAPGGHRDAVCFAHAPTGLLSRIQSRESRDPGDATLPRVAREPVTDRRDSSGLEYVELRSAVNKLGHGRLVPQWNRYVVRRRSRNALAKPYHEAQNANT
ncbi:hypothetical protein C8Q77DRAFT_1156473 [Trametes polyzona]|nr:hypothetical protein C8Q77DRAFT_1156473 [Trametes polyzona]